MSLFISRLTQSSPRLIGALQISLAGFGFGFLGVFGKFAFASGLTIGELLTFRFALATLLLALGLFVFSRRRLRVSGREVLVCAGLGILGYAVFSTLYFKAIAGVSVSLASLLLYTYPVMIALGAHFFLKERLTRTQWIALPLTIVGLFVLLQGEARIQSWLAVAAGLGSALCYTLYILTSSRLQAKIDPYTSGLYVMAFAALGLFAIHQPNPMRLPELSTEQGLIISGIALVSTVAPLTLFLSGLQKLGNMEASLLSTLEPVTAAIAAGFIFDERLSSFQLIGAVLILFGLSITILGRRPTSRL